MLNPAQPSMMGKPAISKGGLIFILGLLSMLMPLSIDMYLPSMPEIGRDFAVSDGMVQLTISSYLIGFAVGQLFYGPLTDSLGRKPIIVGGLVAFTLAAVACALAQSIDQLIQARLLHGLAAAAASVVINALMRDMFSKNEFSRMMSFVTLIMTIAPLLAPILGGILIKWFSWHSIFWVLAAVSVVAFLLVIFFIAETLPKEKRQRFSLINTLRNFTSLFRHRRVLCSMLASGCSFAGMFSFISLGPFVYIDLHGVSPQNFGYYFAVNILFLILMTSINGRYVQRKGALYMLSLGLKVQMVMGVWLIVSSSLDLGFWSLIVGVAGYMGCISMVSSNAMAIILEDYPHMAGTAASLAGTLRFSIGGMVGGLLAALSTKASSSVEAVYEISRQTEWLMVGSMFICVLLATVFFFYSKRGSHKGAKSQSAVE